MIYQTLLNPHHKAYKAIYIDKNPFITQVIVIFLTENYFKLDQSEQSWITLSDTEQRKGQKQLETSISELYRYILNTTHNTSEVHSSIISTSDLSELSSFLLSSPIIHLTTPQIYLVTLWRSQPINWEPLDYL